MSDKNRMIQKMEIPNSVLDFLVSRSAESSAPCYVYDISRIERNCRQFLEIPYENKSIHFATMANINPEFLGIVRRSGILAFVNSLEHLRKVMAAGYPGKDVVFTASAMDDDAMSFVREHDVRVYLDSPSQLARWRRLFPESPVGIRCNIGDKIEPKVTHAGVFLGHLSRLGFTLSEIEEVAGDPLVTALHLYAGTDIQDVDYFMECYRAMWDLARLFPKLDCLNLGGGFSVSDKESAPFRVDLYGERVTRLMEKQSQALGRDIQLMLEPGRIIGCDAGYFFCKITDVKVRRDCQFVGVNASSTQFPRPLLYPDSAFHPVALQRGSRILSGEGITSSVYGCSTYSRDFLARDVALPPAEIGDWIVLGEAGSYCASAHTRFLGFPPAEEIFV